MYIDCSHISCGIYALHGLHGGVSAFKMILNRTPEEAERIRSGRFPLTSDGWKHPTQRFKEGYKYIFSDYSAGLGADIAKFIKDNDLGDITDIGWHKNPNTSNKINMWIWTYNGKKLAATPKRTMTSGSSNWKGLF